VVSGRARQRMPAALLLGAHLSTAGGVSTALERARALRCTAVQLFTHNRAQWRIAKLAEHEVARFRERDAAWGPFALAAHASYLVNAASPDPALRERSIRTLIAELHHCHALGIPLLVFHPGAHMDAGERAGLRRIAGALDRIHRATAELSVCTALETTAGQGSGLGWRFEQLAEILGRLARPERARVCFDTAHAFAAGYDFRTPQQYDALWREFDRRVGLARLALFHLNDSRTPPGSRVDRHMHIGRGEIGRAPFGWILADERFAHVPKVLETPKVDDMDRKNLALLRRLARHTPAHRGQPDARHEPGAA
jgi:deoxyribonuclease-4